MISVDCEWGDWVEGDCSTTCGTGEQNNTRTKLVEEAHGGNCTGGYTNVTSCLVVECPGMYLSLNFNKKNSTYMRNICMYVHMYIYTYNTLTRIIRIHSISVDCEWGDWVEGDCSATCGPGEKNNTRSKLVEEAHGGNCSGESTNVTSCLFVECPGMYLILPLNKKSSTYLRSVCIIDIHI